MFIISHDQRTFQFVHCMLPLFIFTFSVLIVLVLHIEKVLKMVTLSIVLVCMLNVDHNNENANV